MRPLRSFYFCSFIALFFVQSTVTGQCDIDTIPPTAFVVDLSTGVVPATNQIELYAIDFIVYANDDCSNSDSLRFTFGPVLPENDNNYIAEYKSSTMIYDCYDVQNSPVLVSIYIWDEAGNFFTDDVYLTLVTQNGEGCVGCEMDTEPPTILEHIEEITWVIPEGADSVDIWASDFVLGQTDNCTASELIKMSFTPVSPYNDPSSSSMYLHCADIVNSPIEVEVYVWDREYNYTMVTSYINLQNNPMNPDCEEGMINIEGEVISLKGEPIQNATVHLEDESGEILISSETNEIGQYAFFANPDNKYLRIEYQESGSPELTFLDMFAIQQYLLGLAPFSGPQQLAADINADGQIRVNDLKMFRKLILGILNIEDHINTNWQFTNQDHTTVEAMNADRIKIVGNEGPTIIGYRIGDIK